MNWEIIYFKLFLQLLHGTQQKHFNLNVLLWIPYSRCRNIVNSICFWCILILNLINKIKQMVFSWIHIRILINTMNEIIIVFLTYFETIEMDEATLHSYRFNVPLPMISKFKKMFFIKTFQSSSILIWILNDKILIPFPFYSHRS